MKRITSILLALVMILSVMMVSITSVSAEVPDLETALAQCQDLPSDFNDFADMYIAAGDSARWWALGLPYMAVSNDGTDMNTYGQIVLDAYEMSAEDFYDKYGMGVNEDYEIGEPERYIFGMPVIESGSFAGAVKTADCNFARNASFGGFGLLAIDSPIMAENLSANGIYRLRYADESDFYIDSDITLQVNRTYDTLDHWYDTGVINETMTNSEKFEALKNSGFVIVPEILVEEDQQDIPIRMFKSRLAAARPMVPQGDTPSQISNVITTHGNDGTSIVTLDYDTANLRVTVPTVLPVTVDSDNNVTVSDSAKIINYSKGQVDVTNAVLSGNNSWTLAAFDTDFTKVPVDTKEYGFQLNGYNVQLDGNAFNNQFETIAGNAALDLIYNANVAIQSEAIKDAEIGNIVFTVAWHK